jgi:MFS family permease
MTQAECEVDAAQQINRKDGASAADPQSRNAYLSLLRLPGAARFSVAAAIGRTPMAMFGLGTVLLVKATTGQYGLAGLVSAAGSIGYAICAPRVAGLADRLGQRRVLQPLVTVFAISTAVFIACAELHAPLWVLLITGGAAGSSMPSLGSMVRARWSALLAGSPALHSAFALESVADEMIFVAGPAVVTLLATKVLPAAGLGVALVICLAGTLLFAAQRRTEPPVRGGGPDRAGRVLAGRVLSWRARSWRARSWRARSWRARSWRARSWRARSWRARSWRGLAAPALATLAPAYLCIGAMFAAIDLCTVDFAQQQGHKPLAGFVLGTYALGSAIGGLWYGSRTWRAPLERRFVITLATTVAGVATFWAEPSLASLDLSMLVAGLTISPTLIAGYSLVERQASDLRRTEAMTWLSSAISVGVAIGSAVAGQIVDQAGPRPGYVFAACCGALAITVCLLGLRRLRATDDAQAAQWVDAKQ